MKTEKWTQKELAQELDQRSILADQCGSVGATGKQCWFLAKLILENETEIFQFIAHEPLSKKEASALIGSYLNERKAA